MQTVESVTPVFTPHRSADIAERPASSIPIPSKTGLRWRVLIVDDHASIREMLRIVLEGYSDHIEIVGEASDGEEAVTLAEQHPVDLVLMDVNLPHVNGIDATRQIKRARPNVVILGISAEYTPHVYNSMIAAGAVAFVRKEDAADLLFRTIVYAMCTYRPLHVQDRDLDFLTVGHLHSAVRTAAR